MLLIVAQSCSLLLILIVSLHVFADEVSQVGRFIVLLTKPCIYIRVIWIK
nr:MAG TPA: hypothetical protein [Caudoviricetes sp.]